MEACIRPRPLSGALRAIPSKSAAHRALICAAFADAPCVLDCSSTSEDIEATASCLRALGAGVVRTKGGYRVVPVKAEGVRADALLDCGESGSTLRFMLPVVAALGRGASLMGHGRLAKRPLSPLYEEIVAAGCDLGPQGEFPLRVDGRMRAGEFRLPGNVSSQYVTGLLLASPLLGGGCDVKVSEPVQSLPYIDITCRTLEAFGIEVLRMSSERDGKAWRVFHVPKGARLVSPGSYAVEGDWSNAAFWLCAGAMGAKPVTVSGLDLLSPQGDRSVLGALALFGAHVVRTKGEATVEPGRLRGCAMDVGSIPDLVPPLAAIAAVSEGTTRLTNAGRLRLKESDRLASVTACVNDLGGHATVDGDDIVIEGTPELEGGVADACGDHRICMEAAILATRCKGPVAIRGAECVSKSYPAFFEDYKALGGDVELAG